MVLLDGAPSKSAIGTILCASPVTERRAIQRGRRQAQTSAPNQFIDSNNLTSAVHQWSVQRTFVHGSLREVPSAQRQLHSNTEDENLQVRVRIESE